MFPEIKLSDSIVLPTYLVYLSLLYTFLVFYVVRRAQSHQKSVTTALDFAFILMVGGFIGGRLVHILYEAPEYYAQDWTRIFKFWEGGFVFYGGFLVAAAASVIYAWKKKLNFLDWADFYSPILALGYGLGRMSCFFAGCCYGRECDVPWGIRLAWDSQHILRHPTQLYAVFWELIVFALLIFWQRRRSFARQPGRLFFTWLCFHGIGRMIMEYYREDFRGAMIMGLSISTWVSLLILAGGITGLLMNSRFLRSEK